jgi:hypothetical protein
VDDTPPLLKGILKVRRCAFWDNKTNQTSQADKKKQKPALASSPGSKRHLFPTYEPKSSSTPEKGDGSGRSKNKLGFVPMARVLTIPSRKDIPFHQKAQVWWQRSDYDEFKKTGRIISKAMECGGSEIWLRSSDAWGKSAARSKAIKVENNDDNNDKSDSDEYNKALSKYVKEDKETEEGEGDGNKWWCKFGHSRRGLEHIASSTEGKARQQSVVLSQRMVLEEQRRQRISRTKDPNKLRNVSLQYTSWARDLALAGGSADAEAVSSGFDPRAASRAHHFAKRLNVCQNSLHLLNQSDAGGGVAMAVSSQILDANTHASPRGGSRKGSTKEVVKSEDTLSSRAKGFIPGGA